MDEEEFDALIKLRPFGTEDAKRADLQYRRSMSLCMRLALWTKTADDLQRQLMALSPEIPSGFDLADFQDLLRITEPFADATSHLESNAVVVGTLRFTEWEARCEIIRRAIAYLENL
jgi:hypothetical protein